MTELEVVYPADNLAMRGALFLPAAAGPRPGVLVFPEVFGLGAHAIDRARRLADMGYAALACDLHGERAILDDLAAAQKISTALRADPLRNRARAAPALAALIARPEVDAGRIAAIGFCFGGTMALELARSGANLAAIVGFHSGLATVRPEDAANIKGRVLVCIGADDPGIPAEQRAAFEAEMRAGGVAWEMHLYGGTVHSFTNPDADRLGRPSMARYDARADHLSWAAMLALFDEVFSAAAKPIARS
jgi:dienelactone hydrolase